MITHVKCPVFIIHGQADREVPILHGKILISRCKTFYEPWWVEQGGHNDIDIRFRKHYFIRIAKFFRFLTDYFGKRKEKEMESLHKVEDWTANSNHMYYQKFRAVSADKYKEKPGRTIETASFASGTTSSFVSNNTTTTCKAEKVQTESMLIAGSETTRKQCTDTARSMLEYNDEGNLQKRRSSFLMYLK